LSYSANQINLFFWDT
jgi:hypothetical protein